MLRNERICRFLFGWVILVCSCAVFPSRLLAADELEQLLRSEYDDKTFVLRGFYQGERLRYDASGLPVGSGSPGDWTVSGLVRVSSVDLSEGLLTIQGDRLFVVNLGQGFEFEADARKKKQDKAQRAGRLKIEVDLDRAGVTADKAEALLSKVFLTNKDRFAELVPDYWKPCALTASAGLSTKLYKACSFPREFAAIPGLVASPGEYAESELAGPEKQTSEDLRDRSGRKFDPPRPISNPDPKFPNDARQAKYQGGVLLLFVVDKAGRVQNIRILRPRGFGLEEKAVETVATWRFKPAERDGQPIDKEMAVQIDFHLY